MKKTLAFILCVVILAAIPITALADQNAVQVFGYDVGREDHTLNVLLYANADSSFTKENFSLKLGGEALPVDGLDDYSSADYATSWIVVVEPTYSDTNRKMVRAFVSRLMKGMKEKDNLAVYNASVVGQNEFLTKETTIQQLLNSALESKPEEIRLYDSIYSALDTFKTSTVLNKHLCLVVLSMCHDNKSTHQFEEINNVASQLPISVYTIGFSEANEKEFQSFSALARATKGGDYFTFTERSEYAAGEGADRVLSNEKNCFVLSSILTPEIMLPAGDPALTVALQINNQRLEASLDHVDGNQIREAKPESPQDDVIDDPPKPESVWEKAVNWVKQQDLVVMILAGVLLLALIILLIVLLSRKKKKPEKELVMEESGGTAPVVPGHDPTMPISAVTLTLTNVKTGASSSGDIYNSPGTIRAGREEELVLSGDAAISRSHMEFIWQSGILYVNDTNSKSGTKVNGKPVRTMVPLNQSDVIHAGNSDFRVNWQSNS